ncbi:MAG TPA: transporter substrate-binding domain-containing protein [Candidatus Sulfotelmatobacter sp.]|jgi:polar amino acid transport system substrate-binding protein|nr:transporter substrate-binding domain-containing protein [Candidatus Sulfotelmatobacter sp.]
MAGYWKLGVAAAMVLACGMGAAQAGSALDRVNKTHTMVEVLDQNYPPFSFLNDKNEMDGFDIDVSKEVAKRLGVTLKVETPAWEVVAAGHWQGRWDVCICSMTPSKERAEVLDFVTTYYNTPAVLVVSADNKTAKSIKDLSGKKLGAEAGSSYEKYLNKALEIEGGKPIDFPFKDVQVAPFETEELAFQDLALGGGKRLDGVVGNLISVKPRVDKSPDKFRIVGDALFSDANAIAVDKGDAEWKAKVASVIDAMRKDGTLSRISQKWIGTDISK